MTKETKYTPGPWYWDNAGTLRGNGKTRIEFIGADKDLIAAAPELLEELERILDAIDADNITESDIYGARTLIKKVRS